MKPFNPIDMPSLSITPLMEPLNSKSAEQRLSQLCTRLETCQSIDDVQKALSDLDVSVVSRGQAEMVLRQLLAVERLTELVLTSV